MAVRDVAHHSLRFYIGVMTLSSKYVTETNLKRIAIDTDDCRVCLRTSYSTANTHVACGVTSAGLS